MQTTLFNERLQPGETCGLCQKCGLYRGASHPFLPPLGSPNPAITFVLEAPSENDDFAGHLGEKGAVGFLKSQVAEQAKICGFDDSTVRWTTLTRCLSSGRGWKPKANLCRTFLVQDFLDHPPALIVPVGSAVLGLLSHKTNVGDWAGRSLTYRGWPDDWVTDAKMGREGHPLLGAKPEVTIPMIPLQAARLVWATHSRHQIEEWKLQVRALLKTSLQAVPIQNFNLPWYHLSNDAEEITRILQDLAQQGTRVSFDTETNSLRPFAADSAIVFMMFRWQDRQGNPQALGFPWEYPESPLKSALPALTTVVLEVLYGSQLQGHNLTFDILFAYAKLGANLERLTKSMAADTMHMVYTLKQKKMSLGLESLVYDWVPELSGYEEEMVLLIKREGDLLDPRNRKGGHYARCPQPLWESHLKPYVMGDVESVHRMVPEIEEKLRESLGYKIPLSHPTKPGAFRWYVTPTRDWVYPNIMRPSSQVLARLMGRGMHVDLKALTALELYYPAKVMELRNNLRNVDPRILEWCEKNEAQDPAWELDLERADHLKTVLYDLLKLPITTLTEGGDIILGDREITEFSESEKKKYASTDKYTLHKMAVTHPQIRPLQEYKSLFKEFGTFIRPVRKCMSGHGLIDKKFLKKLDKKDPHLCPDGMIHGQFNLSSTRSGRLSSSNPNLQQLKRDGQVKRMFNSRFGDRGVMYNADLSQVELRLIAAACGDANLVGAYRKGLDLHAQTASLIYQIPLEKFGEEYKAFLKKENRTDELHKLKECRAVGKTCNFLTSYGGGALGLQFALSGDGIYKKESECETILNHFFDSYPGLKEYLGVYKSFIEDNGVAVSLLGRVREFPEAFSESRELKSKALRSGCNHLIQSTSSDMMLVILRVLENLMRDEQLESLLVSTVHDSLVIDGVRAELPKIYELTTWVLNSIPEIFEALFGAEYDTSWMRMVPLTGDCEVGHNYGEMVAIPENPDWDKLLAI